VRTQGHRRPYKYTTTVMLVAISSFLLLSPSSRLLLADAAPMDSCFDALSGQRGPDGDNTLLTQSEFVQSIRQLTNNAVSVEYFAYPADLSGAFSNRLVTRGGLSGVPIDAVSFNGRTQLTQFCNDIYTGLKTSLNINIPENICFRGFILGDNSRDDLLERELEYSRFLNNLSGSSVRIQSFGTLHPSLQAVFEDFSNGGTSVSVAGSKPGQRDTVSATQIAFLTQFCDHAAIAIQASEQQATNPTQQPTATPGGNSEPLFTFASCKISMAFSDLSRDLYLNQDEYVRFMNRLTNNDFLGSSFSDLPIVLRANFDAQSVPVGDGTNGIPVAGSHPTANPTQAQNDSMKKVCDATEAAIRTYIGGGISTPAPTTAPPTMAPTENIGPDYIPYSTCTRYLALSDTSRDDRLDEEEYVRFLNFAENRQWLGLTFSQIPQILQDNFNLLATGGIINVAGSKPVQTPTPEQRASLIRFCNQTSEYIFGALNGGSLQPTQAPTGPPETITSEIFNAYLISNTMVGLNARAISSGSGNLYFDSIRDGYKEYVIDTFNSFLASAMRKHRDLFEGMERELQTMVQLDQESITTYTILDTDCPTGISGNCQTVYGKFSILTTTGNPSSVAALVSSLTAKTQNDIATNLMPYILESDPNIPIQVQRAVSQTQPPPIDPTATNAPTRPPAAQGGGGSNPAGAAVGVIVVIIFLVGGGYFLHRKGYTIADGLIWCGVPRKKIPKWVPGPAPEVEKEKPKPRPGSSVLGFDADDYDDENFDPDQQATYLDGHDSDSDFSDRGGGKKTGMRSSVFNAFDAVGGAVGAGLGAVGAVGGLVGVGGKNKKSATAETDIGLGDVEAADEYEDNPANDLADYTFDDPTAGMHVAQSNIAFDDTFGAEAIGDQTAESAKTGDWGSEWGANVDGAYGESDDGSEVRPRDENNSYGSGDSASDEDSYFSREREDNRFTRSPKSKDMPENVRNLDALVEQGNWDGVMAATSKLDSSGFHDDDGSQPSQPSLEESEGSPSDGSESQSSSDDDATDAKALSAAGKGESQDEGNYSSAELKRRKKYKGQVESLVRKVCPEEIDNVDAMLNQFSGREPELINTLETMQKRSTSQRARKAIHKSKALPERDNPSLAAGGTDASAAVALAMTLGATVEDGFDDQADNDGLFDDEEEEDPNDFYGDAVEEDADQYGYGEDNQYGYDEDYGYGDSGAPDNAASFSGSDSGSYSQSYSDSYSRSDDGSFSQDPEGSYSGSYSDSQGSDPDGSFAQEGSHFSNEDGSFSGSGSYSRSDGGGSYPSQEGSFTGSQAFSQEGSYYSNEGGSQEGSYYSNEGGSQEGSYYSNEGGSQEGSYYSGEGEGSYYSNEEGSYDSRQEGSYQSGSYSQGDGSVDYGYE